MMNANDDPVPEADARALRLRVFLQECIASDPAHEAARVREAAALLSEPGAHDPGPIEAMLACGAAESAVLRIIGPDAAFMLSRGQDTCLATMVVPTGTDEVEEILAEASTLALALLAAHVAGLIARAEGCGPALPFSG